MGYGYEEYSEMGFDDLSDDDDFEFEYDYDEDDTEPTWMYEYRGRYFYHKPTIRQKIWVVIYNVFEAIKHKFSKYEDIPF